MWVAGYARLPLVCTNATRLLHCEQTTLSVRVIAIVPTPEKAEALRRKKEHEARAKGRKLSEQARFLAGFILLVTTLPLPQWPTALVIELYAWSFHIEVLFKRIKQLVDLHTLRCETPETAQAVIAALLVAWLLMEEDLEGLRRQLADGEPFAVVVSVADVPCSNTNVATAFTRSWPWTPIRLLFSLVQVLKLTLKGDYPQILVSAFRRLHRYYVIISTISPSCTGWSRPTC